MDTHLQFTVEEKTSIINRDKTTYGSFAEIGAGQEVARWFFRAGFSSNTIAKTMSAYDMVFSDSIYGREESGRYVCESRLIKMLNHEYNLIEERLGQKRGHNTKFFAFANTIAARSHLVEKGHGWLGIRFQESFLKPPSEVVLHVNLLDPRNILQQEAIGLLSVNLIFGALYIHQNVTKLLKSLVDHLKQDRIEIDMIRCSGPSFSSLDNRWINCHLVELGLGQWTISGPGKKVHQPSEILYGKNILMQSAWVQDGQIQTHKAYLESAISQFMKDHQIDNKKDVVVFIHIPWTKLSQLFDQKTDIKKALLQMDMLNDKDDYILISDESTLSQISQHLKEHRIRSCGFIVDRDGLQRMFEKPESYHRFKGGIMEAMGCLFGQHTHIYVPPFSYEEHENQKAQKPCLQGLEDLHIKEPYLNLYQYLLKEKKIKAIAI